MLLHGGPEGLWSNTDDVAPDHDDEIARRQAVSLSSKTLAKQAFQPVSPYRSRYLFARNREAKPGAFTRLATHKDRDTGVGAAEIVLKYLLEFDGARESELPRECLAGRRRHV